MVVLALFACSEVGFSGRIPDAAELARLRVQPESFDVPLACAGEDVLLTPVVFNDGDLPATLTEVQLPAGWATPLSFPHTLFGGAHLAIPMRGPVLDGTDEIVVLTDAEPLSVPVAMARNQPPELAFLDASGTILDGDGDFLRAQIQDDDPPGIPLEVHLESDIDGHVATATASESGFVEWAWPSPLQTPGVHTVTATTTDRCRQSASDVIEVCQEQLVETSEGLGLEAWDLHGAAYYDKANGWLVVAPVGPFQRGSAFRTYEEVVSDKVEISFRFWIGGGTGADGISFTVVDADRATEFLGGDGGGIGYSGLPGWTVEVDVWDNEPIDPTWMDHVSLHVDGIQENILAWSVLPEMEDTGWHEMTVQVTGTRVQVTIDGALYLDVDEPRITPFRGYLGFTGATGGSTHEHRIDSLLVETEACSRTLQ